MAEEKHSLPAGGELPTIIAKEHHPSDLREDDQTQPGKAEKGIHDGDEEKKKESQGSIRDFVVSVLQDHEL